MSRQEEEELQEELEQDQKELAEVTQNINLLENQFKKEDEFKSHLEDQFKEVSEQQEQIEQEKKDITDQIELFLQSKQEMLQEQAELERKNFEETQKQREAELEKLSDESKQKERQEKKKQYEQEKLQYEKRSKEISEQIAENKENIEKVKEGQKKQQEEQKKKSGGIFGFIASVVSAVVSLFNPLAGIAIEMVGHLLDNGDFNGALDKLKGHGQNLIQNKGVSDFAMNAAQNLENVNEDEFQALAQKVKSKGGKIAEHMANKNAFDNFINQKRQNIAQNVQNCQNAFNQVVNKEGFIQQLAETRNALSDNIQKINQINGAGIGALRERREELTQNVATYKKELNNIRNQLRN